MQRTMCVAMRVSCCLKKVMLVCVMSTPSSTLTEDSLCWSKCPQNYFNLKHMTPELPAPPGGRKVCVLSKLPQASSAAAFLPPERPEITSSDVNGGISFRMRRVGAYKALGDVLLQFTDETVSSSL